MTSLAAATEAAPHPAPTPRHDSPIDVSLRMIAACDATTEPAALDVLARDLAPSVRYAAARHPRLSPRTMLSIARSGDATTCTMLGENPAAPLGVVRLLASHVADEVRLAAARHPRLDLTSLQRLADDPSAMVRSIASSVLERRLAATV